MAKFTKKEKPKVAKLKAKNETGKKARKGLRRALPVGG
jgi:hypothetical protein